MNRFVKLVNFEFNRFLKFYLVLIGITIISQIIGVIHTSQKYLNLAEKSIYEQSVPKADFLQQYGTMNLANITWTGWFMGPIALCVVVLIIYVFFIWYRDWFGKNTFSYRLLTLPTSRMNIYLAKATTILIYVLGLVALQLLLLPVESSILQWIVPNEFRTDLSINEVISGNGYLMILYPKKFINFLLYYGCGMIAVFVVFTAILFERSFRIKGIVFGMVYCFLSLVIFLAPLFVDAFVLQNYFYPMELFLMELVTALIVLAGAIWTGHFLLKNKITV